MESYQLKFSNVRNHFACFNSRAAQFQTIALSCINVILQSIFFEGSLSSFRLLNEFYHLMEDQLIKQNASEALHRFNNVTYVIHSQNDASHILYPKEIFDEVTQDFTEDKKNDCLAYQKLTKSEFDELYKKQFCVTLCKGLLLGLSAGFTIAVI